MWEYTVQSLKFTTSLVGGLRATDLVPALFSILWYQGSSRPPGFCPGSVLWTLSSSMPRNSACKLGEVAFFTFSFILTYNGQGIHRGPNGRHGHSLVHFVHGHIALVSA